MASFIIRNAIPEDAGPIMALYQAVSLQEGGIARTYEEITEAYITGFCRKAQSGGIQLVALMPDDPEKIVAEIHCCPLDPRLFSHILSELTIAVHPGYQGLGIGRQIFQALLNTVREKRPDIRRVELIARESNQKAIDLYQKLGFAVEGRLTDRVNAGDGQLEADIPMGWLNDRYMQVG